MVRSVLVICSGNLCRSPVGERLLRRACGNLRVDSAGTVAVAADQADPLAQHVSLGRGLTLEGHVPRSLTQEMARQYDLLLVMEPEHLRQVSALAPWARGKTMLFGHWSQHRTIPDPYRRGVAIFESVFGLLEQDALQWARRLNTYSLPSSLHACQ
ncbi:MAG: protein tyrosine phosphatase [Yokenella regensburgei]|uniref:protein-tyrosine-phosphatase n=2 Tax=Yokenella regensburgei TaxID=158877 RepID=A0ABX9S0W7_9ENTR|nr:protein tyrosine phosphatase [Yokenella regensburgei]MDR3104797.1 protein tyrosine phosphatase [Yokenella regensburgei]RKR64468.1 protein-tyrosine phosphatase [Yokenella regensburgei]